MTDKEKLSEEEYKLAEEVIKPIYYNAIQNDYSFAKYGVECFLAGLEKGREQVRSQMMAELGDAMQTWR